VEQAKQQSLFVFGEAEKGQMCFPIPCHSLLELSETFGNPPENTLGLFYAVQTLLYARGLIYFRVKEEGFSLSDYRQGLKMLRNKEMHKQPLAICLPGVGDRSLIEETSEICIQFHCLFILTEKDLYDYITH
jgi:hypothetical protein